MDDLRSLMAQARRKQPSERKFVRTRRNASRAFKFVRTWCKFVVSPNSASHLMHAVILVDAPTALLHHHLAPPPAFWQSSRRQMDGSFFFWENTGQEQQRHSPHVNHDVLGDFPTPISLEAPLVPSVNSGGYGNPAPLLPPDLFPGAYTSHAASATFQHEFTALTSWDAALSSWLPQSAQQLSQTPPPWDDGSRQPHWDDFIQEGETRYSFTQYSAGGLFRWEANGFMTDEDFERTATAEMKAEKARAHKTRWQDGIAAYSHLDDLV
ncbi:hypothetical protein B0H10DRAFT_1969974 [Mycena sp. CBHHK59/15]|nr:hypothetical protein B0H10DRAFT_1969974 [Mycena sp. CBHHK59/15]